MTDLPPVLATFLRTQEVACLLLGTDQGSALVVKVTNEDVASLGGRMQVRMRLELFDHIQAPVIRFTIKIHDRPDSNLSLETFINLDDPQQRADLESLSHQGDIPILVYDDQLERRLGKRLTATKVLLSIPRIIAHADQLRANIVDFDFDAAKAAVQREYEV